MNALEDTRPTPVLRPPRWRTLLMSLSALIVAGLWLLGTPPGVMGKATAIGYAICHQIVARSFLIEADPMPLCARCTGIYLGVAAALILALVRGRVRVGRVPPLPILLVFGVFVAFMGIDGVNSYFHLFPGFTGIYEPNNTLRLVSGMLCGIAVGTVLLPMFNRAVWAEVDSRRVLDGWADLGALLAIGAVLIGLILAERPLFRLILGLVSVTCVFVMLCLIGCALFFTLSRRVPAQRWRDLIFPLWLGVGVAFTQLGLITLIRFALTGSWGGLIIG